jgi:hypothetical protein
MTAQEQFQEMLETHGGATANRSIQRLLEDPQLMNLQPYTEFVSKTWRDPFIPTLMSLGCQAVNGNQKPMRNCGSYEFNELSFRLWDVCLMTGSYSFTDTFVGKLGKMQR